MLVKRKDQQIVEASEGAGVLRSLETTFFAVSSNQIIGCNTMAFVSKQAHSFSFHASQVVSFVKISFLVACRSLLFATAV